MPLPNRKDRLDPDDLARQVARRLADTGVPRKKRSLRDSVLLGRLVSGLALVAIASALVLVAMIGLNWVADESGADTATTPSFLGPDQTDQEGVVATTGPAADPVPGLFSSTTTLGPPFLPTPPSTGGGFPSLPPPTTTSSMATTTPTTGGTPTTATSIPTTSSSSSSTSSTSTSTSTSSTSTTTSSTTTTTQPTTTTTEPPTTTTQPPTTTTIP